VQLARHPAHGSCRPRPPSSCSSRGGRLRPLARDDRHTRDRRLRSRGYLSDSSGMRRVHRLETRAHHLGALQSLRHLGRLRLHQRARFDHGPPAALAVRGESRSPGSTERGLGFRTRSGNTPHAQVTARWPRSQVPNTARSPGITRRAGPFARAFTRSRRAAGRARHPRVRGASLGSAGRERILSTFLGRGLRARRRLSLREVLFSARGQTGRIGCRVSLDVCCHVGLKPARTGIP
jgi:hypothetical protein